MQISQPRRGRGRPRKAVEETAVERVQTLDRAIRLLQLVAEEDGLTLNELSERLELPAPTAYRLLNTLRLNGMVVFDDDLQTWFVGIETFRLGSAYLRRTGLIPASRPVMQHLMEQCGETVNLAIEQDGDVVFVSQVESAEPIRAFFRPGTRGDMHASGIGKALLAEHSSRGVRRVIDHKGLRAYTEYTLTSSEALVAELDLIRKRGWSVDNEEKNLGMRCVAAPIFNEHGEAIAGVSVSGPTVRVTTERIEQIGPEVRAAADRITEVMGGQLPRRSGVAHDAMRGW